MNKPYLLWAIVGMIGYSFTALFVKLATQSGRFSSFLVLSIAAIMVVVTAIAITACRGDFKALTSSNILAKDAAFAFAAGIALTVAVSSFFLALSLGPASVVVPIYGMFIVGGSALGLLFLHEPLTLRKAAGICFAVASIYLIARKSSH